MTGIAIHRQAQLRTEIRHGLALYSSLDADEADKVAEALTEHLFGSPVFTNNQKS